MDGTLQLPDDLKGARIAFLNNTLDYYGTDTSRRGLNEYGRCSYRGKNNTRCAIGRWIPDDQYKEEYDNVLIGGSINEIIIKALPVNIRKLGLLFLQMVQTFHDNPENWNKYGITEDGKNNYKRILQYIEKEKF